MNEGMSMCMKDRWMDWWTGRWMSGGMSMLRTGKKWSWSIFLCSCTWSMFCHSASVRWPVCVRWLCSSICSYLTLMPPLPDQQTTWRAALQCLTRAPACFLGSKSWMTFWPTMFLFQKCTSLCPPSSSRHHSQSWLMDPEYVLILYDYGSSLRFSIPLLLPIGTMSDIFHSLHPPS